MNKTVLCLLAILIFFPVLGYSTGSTGELTVNINGFKGEKGAVVVTLYNSKDGFPEKPEKAIKKMAGEITGGKAQVVFSDISYGEYAVSVLHDENENGEMDKNMLGIPKEGSGASNNPDSFGPPKYKDAKFNVNSEKTAIDIKLKYLN